MPDIVRRVRILQMAARPTDLEQFRRFAFSLLQRKRVRLLYHGRERDTISERMISPQGGTPGVTCKGACAVSPSTDSTWWKSTLNPRKNSAMKNSIGTTPAPMALQVDRVGSRTTDRCES